MLTKEKRRHLLALIVYPVLASFLAFVFEFNFLWSIILFFGIPSVHLSFLLPKAIKKTLLFSLILAVPLALVVDYVAHLTLVWYVPTVFPFRILGQVPVEDMLWGVLLGFYTIMFYEYFFDAHRDRLVLRPKMRIALLILTLFVGIFFIIFFVAPHLLHIPFFYFWFGTVIFLLPVVLEFFRRPRLIQKFFPTAIYFFFVAFIYEVTALKLDWWTFPGDEVLGWVTFLGAAFPFEELFFWFVITAMTILSYYEFYDDDEK